MNKCCDNCTHYSWYYDYCNKWNCKVDDRSVCSEWNIREVDNEYIIKDIGKSKD